MRSGVYLPPQNRELTISVIYLTSKYICLLIDLKQILDSSILKVVEWQGLLFCCAIH